MTAKLISVRHRTCGKRAPQGDRGAFWTALHDYEVNRSGNPPRCHSCRQPIPTITDVTRVFEQSLQLADWTRLAWAGNPNHTPDGSKAARRQGVGVVLDKLAGRLAELAQEEKFTERDRKRLGKALETLRDLLGQ